MEVVLSAGGAWWRGPHSPLRALALEILAQAAIVVLGQGEGGPKGGPKGGLLAGIDRAVFRGDLLPGERLEARLELRGRFGRLVKVAGSLSRPGGETVVEADLLLALEG